MDDIDRWRKRLERRRYRLTPNSRSIRHRDTIIVVGALFTASVTPLEIAFASVSRPRSLLFAANRAFDAVYLLDIAMHFFLGYEDGRGFTITDWPHTARHYVRTAFFADLVSWVPYDLVAWWLTDHLTQGLTTVMADCLRVLRVLRMLKLSRMALLQPQYPRLFKDTSFAMQSLLRFCVLLMCLLHWLACVWILVAALYPGDHTWLSTTGVAGAPAANQYCAAFYYASCLVVSGAIPDESAPANDVEKMALVGMMAVGGFVYVYAVGCVCRYW
jgi:hypothetical protein